MKMLKSKLLFTTVVSLSVEGSAFALVRGELGAGQKSEDYLYNTPTEKDKKKSVTGSEVFFNLYFDPIPAVPVAFGLAVQSYTLDLSKAMREINTELNGATGITATGTGKAAGLIYGPSIKVWAPIPFVKPFLKYTYLTGTEKVTSNVDLALPAATFEANLKETLTNQRTGSEIHLGVGYAPLPLISIFLEYAMFTGTVKAKSYDATTTMTVGGVTTTTEATVDDLSDDDKKPIKSSTRSIRLGLSVGI